jgi:hypothetical protein
MGDYDTALAGQSNIITNNSIVHLATSGSCFNSKRMVSVLMRTAQITHAHRIPNIIPAKKRSFIIILGSHLQAVLSHLSQYECKFRTKQLQQL